MSGTDVLIQRIIAVLGMCVWFIFPIGMFLSVYRQDREEKTPHANPVLNDREPHTNLHTNVEHNNWNMDNTDDDFEEPMKIDDFGHTHVSINPGPDHQHLTP